jgi:hypothetical protein
VSDASAFGRTNPPAAANEATMLRSFVDYYRATILRQTRYARSLVPRGPLGRLACAAIDHNLHLRRAFLAAGFAWVDVDVRGSGASGGTQPFPWHPGEVADGAAVVDWIVAQPWSGQGWNPYSYVLNRPLAYVDPSGLYEVLPNGDTILDPPIIEADGAMFFPIPALDQAEAQVEGSREAMQVGATAAPVDVSTTGSAAAASARTSARSPPMPPGSPEAARNASLKSVSVRSPAGLSGSP